MNNPNEKGLMKPTKKREEKHEIGKCGAVVHVTKKGDVCAECGKLMKPTKKREEKKENPFNPLKALLKPRKEVGEREIVREMAKVISQINDLDTCISLTLYECEVTARKILSKYTLTRKRR